MLNPGATLAPGTHLPGTLQTANQTWNGGVTLTLRMSGADAGEGAGWSFLEVNGSLNITAGAGNPLFIDLESIDLAGAPGLVTDFDNTLAYNWRLATATEGFQFNPGESADTTFVLRLDRFQNDSGGGCFDLGLANGNRDLILSFTPIPEPGVKSMLALGFLLFFARARFCCTEPRQRARKKLQE